MRSAAASRFQVLQRESVGVGAGRSRQARALIFRRSRWAVLQTTRAGASRMGVVVRDSTLMFKIYVGNLDYKVKVEQLRELFAVYAPIEDLVIPLDPKTNRAKGFGIVMIRDAELGRAAVKAMQGKRLLGRTLVVNEAVKKKKSGAPEPISKADLVRNGPFGPRMYRVGDPRGRVTRNPRRSSTTGSAPGAGSGSTPSAASPASPSNSPSMGAAPARPVAPGVVPGAAPGGSPKPAMPAARPAAPDARPEPRPLARPAAAPAARTASTHAPAAPAPAPAAPARPKATKLATPKRPTGDSSGDGGTPPASPASG